MNTATYLGHFIWRQVNNEFIFICDYENMAFRIDEYNKVKPIPKYRDGDMNRLDMESGLLLIEGERAHIYECKLCLVM